MKPIIAATLLFGTACFAGGALAQTSPAPAPSMPPAAAPSVTSPTPRPTAAPATDTKQVVAASALERGANSFTEGQARGRFEEAGFTGIQNLMKDEAGFWRGRGMRGGAAVDLAMDFRGRIAAGPDVASLPAPTPASRTGTTPPPASTR